jgi:hypothetical protein
MQIAISQFTGNGALLEGGGQTFEEIAADQHALTAQPKENC